MKTLAAFFMTVVVLQCMDEAAAQTAMPPGMRISRRTKEPAWDPGTLARRRPDRTDGILTTFLVRTTDDTGSGSLRKAMTDASQDPGPSLIQFDIPGDGPHSIRPLSKLPNITSPLIIDGTSQPGYSGTPLIEISGDALGSYSLFDVFAGNSVIRGLALNRCTGGTAIVLWTAGGNIIEGNFIGTDVTGTAAPGNTYNGVIVYSGANRIGGTLPGSRNVFSGNGFPAVVLSGPACLGNMVEGNLFGTDVTGSDSLGNVQEAVLVTGGAAYDTIGGSSISARNVIAGSRTASGISIVGPTVRSIRLTGNYIGTDVTGTRALANGGNGVYILDADSTVIGGPGLDLRNVISGNAKPAVFIDGIAAHAVIQNNYIGLSALSIPALPNSKGIVVNGAPDNSIIGNYISGNTSHGIEIRGTGATGNCIRGNSIGLAPVFNVPMGNGGHGVLINTSADTVGTPGDGNTIAFNAGAGVFIASGHRNPIHGNSIYGNGALGIDLFPLDVIPNDTLDADTGANDEQNYPKLDSLKRRGASTDVYGHLMSSPDNRYLIEFFADSGDFSRYGQGQQFLGSITAPTGASGIVQFSVSLPRAVSTREVVTATATDADGNTSEFCRGIGKDYQVTNPLRGKLWVVGDVDTIRWESADTGHVRLEVSRDSGVTYTTITADTDGHARLFPWKVQKALSTRCRIRVNSVADPSMIGESELFKIKGVELTRYTADSSYEAFSPALHGWRFANSGVNMWPPAWYNRFNYVTDIDPATGLRYPAAWSMAGGAVHARSSDFPDWQLFVSAFGIPRCYNLAPAAPPGYLPSAVAFWTATKGNWGGSCFGFALSSVMAFDAPAAFRAAEPGMPPFINLYPLLPDTARTLQTVVNRLFLYTIGKGNKIQSDAHANDPLSSILDSLTTDFLSDTRNDRLFSVWDRRSFGHTVAPYKIERDSSNPSLRHLYVYDSNNPGLSDKQFIIDLSTDSWSFPPLGWGNVRHAVISLPVSTDFVSPDIPRAAFPRNDAPSGFAPPPGRVDIYNPAGTAVVITNETGQQVRYADSVITEDIPGADLINPPTGGAHPPIGCSLPPGRYTVDFSSPPDTASHLFVFSDSTVYACYRNSAASWQRDRFVYDGGLTATTSDSGHDGIGLQGILIQPGGEKSFDVTGVSMNPSDSLRVQIQGGGALVLSSHGSPRGYNLQITNAASTGNTVFAHTGIPLPGNSTHRIEPVWDDLANQMVKILIDHGNRGSFDDSLLVQNQLTGAPLPPGGGTHTGTYWLGQNYPNPFNPSTVIEYRLAARQAVSLEIFNLLGQRVASLVEGVESQGPHRVVWTPGATIASGVYFCRLRAGSFSSTRTMVLVR